MIQKASFSIGDRVNVVQNPAKNWTWDWKDTYVVTGARLEYHKPNSPINYSIALQEEIDAGMGDTDGFDEADLTPA